MTATATPVATSKQPAIWLVVYVLPKIRIDKISCHTKNVCKIKGMKNYIEELYFGIIRIEYKSKTLSFFLFRIFPDQKNRKYLTQNRNGWSRQHGCRGCIKLSINLNLPYLNKFVVAILLHLNHGQKNQSIVPKSYIFKYQCHHKYSITSQYTCQQYSNHSTQQLYCAYTFTCVYIYVPTNCFKQSSSTQCLS